MKINPHNITTGEKLALFCLTLAVISIPPLVQRCFSSEPLTTVSFFGCFLIYGVFNVPIPKCR